MLLVKSHLSRQLLYICLVIFLTTNFSFANDDIKDTDDYYYLSKEKIRSLHVVTPVNGWGKLGNINFNTLKWKSFLEVFYQVKVDTPESNKYDYYIESNTIDCVAGIDRYKQNIDYYKNSRIISSEESRTHVDYSVESWAELVCELVKSDYLKKELASVNREIEQALKAQ